MLQKSHKNKSLNKNCVDSLGRGALTLAIDGENLEMVELLIIMGIKTKDALLHAINAEFVEAVELLLEHEELIHKDGEPYSWETVDINVGSFTPDITPLVLAAHRNNYEILKILLDRGATIPMPHDIKCGCDDCIRETKEDSLRHSLSRLNEYRALASSSLIALSSSDPILTAFQLSWELRNLALAEPECKAEYLELRRHCQQFAVDLLQQTRSSQELAIVLNHDPDNTPYQDGEHMKLARLELAINYKQKKFVAHPNVQQLLAALWYEGVPGFKRKSTIAKLMVTAKTAAMFPFYSMLYMIAPTTETGKLMRKPFMKFLIHASSYLFFLFILILVSQRAEDHLIHLFGTESMKTERFIKQRGNPPALLEYVVLLYVIGFIYEETYEIIVEGVGTYLRNLWNIIDFSRNFVYIMVFLLRVVAYIQQASEIANDPTKAYIPREQWNAFDPQLIAEGLFAAANIFSALKLVHLFSINPHLGPLQISLGRMVIDIVKFFFIYSLVLFAFACGLNQLLWYFSDLERKKCYVLPNGAPDWENAADSCLKWRGFANVFEASQSLFWASFGLVDLANFELTGIKTYTRFWGLLMFGSYSVINIIVLLNLLIAMMSNSYAIIEEHSDTEWKFARTKLWMSYFEEGNTLPPPFNIFPTVKTFLKSFQLRKVDKLRRMSTKQRKNEEKERDYRYTSVMRALVWRYVSSMHKKMEEDVVTEDDINEVKGDISAFRYDILEVLSRNGMDVSAVEKRDKAVLGKKMKIWERRLMKDFKVAPVVTDEEADKLLLEGPPENEDALSKFKRVAKLAVLNSNLNKWGQVISGACLASSQIGHCSNKDSFIKQQKLLKAMEEAKKLALRSPVNISRASSPMLDLPDTTGESIMEILKDIKDPHSANTPPISPLTALKVPVSPNVIIKPPIIALSPPTPIKRLETISSPPETDDDKTQSADDSSLSKLEQTPKTEVEDFILLNTDPVITESNLVDVTLPSVETDNIEETPQAPEPINISDTNPVLSEPSDEIETNNSDSSTEQTSNEISVPNVEIDLMTEKSDNPIKGDNLEESISNEEENSEVPQIPELKVTKSEPLDVTTSKPVAMQISGEKSPMSARNITRIGDSSPRKQPKTGWL